VLFFLRKRGLGEEMGREERKEQRGVDVFDGTDHT